MLSLGLLGPESFPEEMIKQTKDHFEKHRDLRRTRFMIRSLIFHRAIRGEFPAVKDCWKTSGLTACNEDFGLGSKSMTEGLSLITLQFDYFDWMIKVKRADDIRRAKAEGKLAVFLNSQFIDAIGQDLDNLDMLYDFGLRVLQLTYNRMNYVAGGCTERTDAGVSNFGVDVIERMNELGIIVDTGHCGRQTTLDACEISGKPVIASHTAAKGVYAHDRGKDDEALMAIAKTGGVIGVCILPFFISGEEEVTMQSFLDHIDYIAKLAGCEHVGIGTDAPFSLPEWVTDMNRKQMAAKVGFRPEHGLSGKRTKGFDDNRDFINITRGLVSRGYSDEQVRAILGGNWLRVMDAVWK
jgi:membrane dipeptidase